MRLFLQAVQPLYQLLIPVRSSILQARGEILALDPHRRLLRRVHRGPGGKAERCEGEHGSIRFSGKQGNKARCCL